MEKKQDATGKPDLLLSVRQSSGCFLNKQKLHPRAELTSMNWGDNERESVSPFIQFLVIILKNFELRIYKKLEFRNSVAQAVHSRLCLLYTSRCV